MTKSRHTFKSRCMLLASMITLTMLACACAPAPVKRAEPVVSQTQLLAAGEAAEQTGDYNRALMEYVKAVTAYPISAEPHYRIARVHTKLGNPAPAQEAFMRVLSINPKHVAALEGLGLLRLEQGQQAEATRLLKQALALDARRWRSLNGLGVLADLAGDHHQAQSHFSAGLTLAPSNPELLNNLGYSYYLEGNLKMAQDYFERALSKVPDYKTAWSNLALVKVRKGDYPGAIDAFSESLKPYQAYNNVGYLLYMQGKLDTARDYLQRAIALSPSYYSIAQDNLRRVEAEAKNSSDGSHAGLPPLETAK